MADLDRTPGEDSGATRIAAVEHPSPPPLPTMDDLDRLAGDLDSIDATLAALDREVGDTGEVDSVHHEST